jgi:heme/copper-type cytochrome/quinol oxidase subunit 2
MNYKDFSEKIISEIKKHKIKPKPRWQFIVVNFFIWFLGVLALILGSFIFSVILYMFIDNDWDATQYIGGNFIKFVFIIIPYFWLVSLAGFSLAVFFIVRCTKKGYKYPFWKISLVSTILSIFLGSFFYGVGVGRAIDETLSQKTNFYKRIVNHRSEHWMNPENGFLGGRIKSINSEKSFFLIDFKDYEWKVFYENALIMPSCEISEGKKIRMFGKIIGKDGGMDIFEAEKILSEKPFGGILRPGRDMNKYFLNPPCDEELMRMPMHRETQLRIKN